MKKSLVLAMAMALGVTASAYAANPFSDVPAGHWAYDSVAKLAAAGVVDGYVDGAFGGDKLMTRYEMAQIVAKAMAKGANVDKLAAEFADELDTLGVRVAKLEKGADAVKIAGNIRLSYRDIDGVKGTNGRLRTRLIVKGAINDDWTYTGRFENNQYFSGKDSKDVDYGAAGEDEVKLNWAYVSGKIGGLKTDIGRQDVKLHIGSVIDTRHDAVKVQYGKDVKFTGIVGKGAQDYKFNHSDDRLYVADLATKLGVVDAYATWYKAVDADTAFDSVNVDKEIFTVGAALPLAKDLKLNAEWLNGDAEAKKDDNGYVVGLSYKGAKASAPGSWGVFANYFDQPASTLLYNSIQSYAGVNFDTATDDGFEGYELRANYTLAKNIVATVRYYDLEAREGKADDVKTIWGDVTFTF